MTTAIYRNPFTFLEAPWYRDLPEADVVISGIPFDLATSGREVRVANGTITAP